MHLCEKLSMSRHFCVTDASLWKCTVEYLISLLQYFNKKRLYLYCYRLTLLAVLKITFSYKKKKSGCFRRFCSLTENVLIWSWESDCSTQQNSSCHIILMFIRLCNISYEKPLSTSTDCWILKWFIHTNIFFRKASEATGWPHCKIQFNWTYVDFKSIYLSICFSLFRFLIVTHMEIQKSIYIHEKVNSLNVIDFEEQSCKSIYFYFAPFDVYICEKLIKFNVKS